jgi:hypothetical protein
MCSYSETVKPAARIRLVMIVKYLRVLVIYSVEISNSVIVVCSYDLLSDQ